MKKLLLLILALLWPASLLAQGVCVEDIALGKAGNFVRPLSQASVRVCQADSTAGPDGKCTPLQTVYSDRALTQVISGSTVTADLNGNYRYCISSGVRHDVEVSAQGFTTYKKKDILGGFDATFPITAESLVAKGSPWFDVKAYGAVCDGVTNSTAAIQAAVDAALLVGGTVYFPSCTSSYLVTAPINFPGDAPPVTLLGSAGGDRTNRGSHITGNFADAIFKRTGQVGNSTVIFKHLQITNTHASGEGIRMNGVISGGVYHCRISAFRAIIYDVLTFSNTFAYNLLQGPAGFPIGSIGIYSGGHAAFINNDVVGWDNGYRLVGTGNAVIGGRYEVNRTAIRTGIDLAGTGNTSFRGGFIGGIRGEANDIFLDLEEANGITVSGVNVQGGVNSPSTNSATGVRIHQVNNSTFQGFSIGGTFTNAAVEITSAARDRVLIQGGFAEVNAGGGVAWKVDAAVGPEEVSFIETNYPSATAALRNFHFNVTGNNLFGILDHSNTATRTYTFPDAAGTLPLLGLAQTWTAQQTFSASILPNATGVDIGSAAARFDAFLQDLDISGQFTSTLTTGTAPLVVASTTKVTNLNADLLDGADWAAPAAIGTTTPAAATFTTVTVSGDLTPNGGITADSAGFKHARVTTGSIAAGSNAAVTVTWTTAFADANYTIQCSVVEATASTSTLRVHHIQSVAAASVVIRVVNDDGAAAKTGTLHCTATHD